MNTKSLKADVLLLTTATIWGCAFVAQRVGGQYVEPYTFNAIRFVLGALALSPIVWRGLKNRGTPGPLAYREPVLRYLLWGGLAGLCLFAGASLQQIGLLYTTAGKAGFITGLYVVFVPIGAMFFGAKQGLGVWLGAALAASGLYLLSITESFTMEYGDLLQLIGAFFWAGHVLLIGYLTTRTDPLKLAVSQYAACAVFSGIAGILFETTTMEGLTKGAIPILYGGLVSVGVAYTLQIVAQRDAPPAHASVLLSMESVFAALSGWLMLGETMSSRAMLGCTLMFAAMLVSQLWPTGSSEKS